MRLVFSTTCESNSKVNENVYLRPMTHKHSKDLKCVGDKFRLYKIKIKKAKASPNFEVAVLTQTHTHTYSWNTTDNAFIINPILLLCLCCHTPFSLYRIVFLSRFNSNHFNRFVRVHSSSGQHFYSNEREIVNWTPHTEWSPPSI